MPYVAGHCCPGSIQEGWAERWSSVTVCSSVAAGTLAGGVTALCFLLQLALAVAQHRDRTNVLSGIKMAALEEGLKKIFLAAKKKKGRPSLCAQGEGFCSDMCCDF